MKISQEHTRSHTPFRSSETEYLGYILFSDGAHRLYWDSTIPWHISVSSSEQYFHTWSCRSCTCVQSREPVDHLDLGLSVASRQKVEPAKIMYTLNNKMQQNDNHIQSEHQSKDGPVFFIYFIYVCNNLICLSNFLFYFSEIDSHHHAGLERVKQPLRLPNGYQLERECGINRMSVTSITLFQ